MDDGEITQEMIDKAQKLSILGEKKKRKLEEIEKLKKENEIVGDPDDYENYGKSKLVKGSGV